MNKRGQVWIETVVYTLIGLSLIGLVIAIVTPKINEYRDRTVIEQTIDSLNKLDSKISEVLSAPGNVRIVEFRMRQGEISFEAINDRIVYELKESRSLYSEPGLSIKIGRINVTTNEGVKRHSIRLELDYSQYNITFNDAENNIKFTSASVPYKFAVENKGTFEGVTLINIRES